MVASARRMSSLHSSSVRMLSMTAAKRGAYLGIGGSVTVKSILRIETLGGASGGRKVSILYILCLSLDSNVEKTDCGGR